MPDRFADGDPSERPASRAQPACMTAAKPMAYHGGDLRGIRQHLGLSARPRRHHAVAHSRLEEHRLRLPRLSRGRFLRARRSHGIHAGIPGTGRRRSQAGHESADRFRRQSYRPAIIRGPTIRRRRRGCMARPRTIWTLLTTFAGLVDPHASPREYLATLEGWFAGKLPDLNPDDPAARPSTWRRTRCGGRRRRSWMVSALTRFLTLRASSGADGTNGCARCIRTINRHRRSIGRRSRPSPHFLKADESNSMASIPASPTVFDFPL